LSSVLGDQLFCDIGFGISYYSANFEQLVRMARIVAGESRNHGLSLSSSTAQAHIWSRKNVRRS
jgi:hypothetical protein